MGMAAEILIRLEISQGLAQPCPGESSQDENHEPGFSSSFQSVYLVGGEPSQWGHVEMGLGHSTARHSGGAIQTAPA